MDKHVQDIFMTPCVTTYLPRYEHPVLSHFPFSLCLVSFIGRESTKILYVLYFFQALRSSNSRVVFTLWRHHFRVLASCNQELHKGQKSSFLHIFGMWADPFLLPTPFLFFTPTKWTLGQSRKKEKWKKTCLNFGSISNLFLIGCLNQRNCTNCSTEWAICLENTLPGLWLTTNRNKIARKYTLLKCS